MFSRRMFVAGASAALTYALLPGGRPVRADATPGAALTRRFSEIETAVGGRLGVAVSDPGTGLAAELHGDERFPMCSTFKLLAVAAVLNRVDKGEETLSREVPVPKSAILSYAPVTEKHAGGVLSLSDLCAAAMVWSDNTAANLVLETVGGPEAATAYVRSLGDDVTRMDRMEPALNDVGPGEVRDTTTPNAMLGNLDKLFVGDALSPLSRDLLTEWFVGCKTGTARLRAGLPETWRVGDRTGTGPHGTSNDVAVAWPTGPDPILIAAFLTGSKADETERDAALADVGEAIASAVS
ncbi:class A beta-lactamase [Methyloceanibacter methanicus]|uniref:Beta-lactamase n=1 Tax=Methyloceanibacter methanicus TaxID=1774968 RepID=A0A1E3VWZ2_9HYPH|nr:class A beta-lactamase [Methyloceanibacter methanicus]ODR98032.1 class A beta-lactamase [Methyloceanibacter methanicus]